MLAKHTTPFDRIFTHRLDAASQYLHDKEQTRQFTDTIQGNELTKIYMGAGQIAYSPSSSPCLKAVSL